MDNDYTSDDSDNDDTSDNSDCNDGTSDDDVNQQSLDYEDIIANGNAKRTELRRCRQNIAAAQHTGPGGQELGNHYLSSGSVPGVFRFHRVPGLRGGHRRHGGLTGRGGTWRPSTKPSRTVQLDTTEIREDSLLRVALISPSETVAGIKRVTVHGDLHTQLSHV